ncbi:MAG TPA: ATP-binding protein [Spirochaetota bacterium]|nr:ATP-binding protein [Spirochaetota bacterium]HQO01168.1 ATP-binding protein [Spirochaetota bacterium]HQP47732.1 ATP-binding protein [Spirochaetota bacterium]
MTNQNKSDQSGSKFCEYCEHTGIIRHPYYKETGEEPLSPCPRCVLSVCKCNSEEPYFYYDGGIRECECRETRMKIDRIKFIYAASAIDKKYQWRFINEFESRNKLTDTAKSAAYDIIRSFPDVKKGLYLWGNPGTGKTLLSTIILTELIIRHAVEGRFVKISRNFFNRLRATFAEGSETYGTSSAIEREFAEVDVLVIDDFGTQRDSTWEQETLYNLVDARYEAEKFTIFTSNNSPLTALKDISGGRVLSRIKEMCRIMEISGPDYRETL